MNQLEIDLRSWDGVHTDYLIKIYEKRIEQTDFLDRLITLIDEVEEIEIPATWLIKNHFDLGNKLAEEQIDKLLGAVSKLTHWAAQLHMLQLLPEIDVDQERYTLLLPFVENGIMSDAKFVRAWAYQGYYKLSQFNDDLKPKLRLMCQAAMETESASVRSKIKRILNAL